MQVERIKVGQLVDFVAACVNRPGADLPMSSRRAESLAQHPLVLPEDVLLYVIREDGAVIAFQNLVSDSINDKHFMWLSAVWVRADWRGRRLASAIFSSILKDTQGLLAATNQAPVRQKRMRKDDRFVEMDSPKVMRWYRRFSLHHFLSHRLPSPRVMRPLLKGTDMLLNAIHDRVWDISAAADGPQPERGKKCTEEDRQFLAQSGSFSSLDADLLSWRLQYPWLDHTAADRAEQKRYAFSVYAEEFENHWWRFRNERGEIHALLWVQLRDGHVKVPLWNATEAGQKISASYLRQWLHRKKVCSVTLPASELNSLAEIGYSGWLQRPMAMPVFVHQDLAARLTPDAWSRGYGLHRGDWGMT